MLNIIAIILFIFAVGSFTLILGNKSPQMVPVKVSETLETIRARDGPRVI